MAFRPRTTKYGNRKVSVDGKVYHSQMEAQWALLLKDHVNKGRILEVKEQHKIVITIEGHKITTHIVDFLITLPDGRKKYVEVKGFPTEVWLIKRKLVEATETIPYLVNPTDRQLFL